MALYGSKGLARPRAGRAGGCSHSRALATVRPGAVESPGNRPGGEFLDLGQAANLAHKATFMARPFGVGGSQRDGPAQDIAELHQSSAGPGPAALAACGQGKDLGERGFMGDQVVGQQFVAGLEQAGQGHPQPRGQGAVAVERQAVLVADGDEEEVQQDGLAREVVHVLGARSDRRSRTNP